MLLILGASIASVGIWFGLIDGPRRALVGKQRARATAQDALTTARKQIVEAGKAKIANETAQAKLEAMESKMPVGDPYRWLVKAFVDFPGASRVTIGNIEPPHVSESGIYPKVPYKTAAFSINGVGFYHDFGSFLAELENEFPHMRIRKVDLAPAYPGDSDSPEGEKLNFQVDMSVLFKATAAPAPTQLSLGPARDKKN